MPVGSYPGPQHTPPPAISGRNTYDRKQAAERSAGKARDSIWGLTPGQRNALLIQKGYFIPQSDKPNVDTRSAAYAYIHGISPADYRYKWNAQDRVDASNKVLGQVKQNNAARAGKTGTGTGGKAGTGTSGASGISAGTSGGAGGNTAAPSGPDPLTGLLKQEADTKVPLSQQMSEKAANTGSMEDPETMAQMAGQSFQASIQELMKQQQMSKAQLAQNITDISGWYGQVLKSVDVAAGRDTEASKAGIDSVNAITKGLVSSLGGASNAASGQVASTGDSNVGLLQAQGTAQDQYNQDVQPILQNEAAGQKTKQTALNTQAQAAFASKMADLMGQKLQAMNDKRTEAMRYNDTLSQQRLGNLQSIRQSNAQGRQQDYNNKMGSLSARAGLISSGMVAGDKSSIAHQNADANTTRANAAAIRAMKTSSGRKAWGALSPGERTHLIGQFTGGMLNPDGSPKPGVDFNTFTGRVKSALTGLGYTDPNAMKLAISAVNAPAGWNRYGN